MDVFNVSANPIIAELGFGSSLGFDDPMNTPYSGQDNNYTQFTNEYVIDTLLPDLYNSDAYKNEDAIRDALSSYYLTHTYGETATYSSAAPTSAAYGGFGNGEAAASWAGPAAAQGAKPTGSMSQMRVVPSQYSAGAPFTFTDSIPTQVTAMSIAVMQATNTAVVETIHFGPPSFPSGSESYGPPAGFAHPTGPPQAPPAAVSTAAAAVSQITDGQIQAPPATTPATTAAPAPPAQQQWSAPAFSAPAHSWGPPAAPSEAPAPTPAPAPAPAPAPSPSQARPAAPAPPAEQPQGPPAAFSHPQGPPAAPAAPAWTPPAAAPAPPAAPAWSAPAPPAAAPPQAAQNHPSAPGFFPGTNSAPQAGPPQAAPAGPPSFGGGAPSFGGHHKREAKAWKA